MSERQRDKLISRGLTAALVGVLIAPFAFGPVVSQEGMGRRPVPSFGRADPGPSHIWINPGPSSPRGPVEVENPYAGMPDAIAEGQRLYAWFHCAECHAPGGGGYIGPSLRDPYWIYGGEPASIYQSIWSGRPNGMPTWANKIPDDQIWKIIAFIQAMQDPAPDALQPSAPSE